MMKILTKPQKLNVGDKIATVSLSWGGAGENLWRYEQGKKRLEEVFGLEVVEMTNTLKGAEYIYSHPEKRAEDLMKAFEDTAIKGFFAVLAETTVSGYYPILILILLKTIPKYSSDTPIPRLPILCALKQGFRAFMVQPF